jgi:hypothetical protein
VRMASPSPMRSMHVAKESRGSAGDFPRRVVLRMVLGVIYLGAVSSYERFETLMSGRLPDRQDEVGAGRIQYAREILLLLLVMVLLGYVRRLKLASSGYVTMSVGVVLYGVLLLVLEIRSLLNGMPWVLGVFAIRGILFASLIASVRFVGAGEVMALLEAIAARVKPLILVELVLAVVQAVSRPGYFGTTLIGSRPWGTYSAPNNLSMAMLGFVILFAVTKLHRRWVWISMCMVGLWMAGTRMGLIVGLLVVMLVLLEQLPSREAMLIPLVLFSPIVLLLASTKGFSGREISGEGRLGNWGTILGGMSWGDRLLGVALGAGSNSAATALGQGTVPGTEASDSQILAVLMSTGLVGLVVIGAIFLRMIAKVDRSMGPIFLVVIAGGSMVYSLVDYYPLNVVVALGLGASLPKRAEIWGVSSQAPPLPQVSGSGRVPSLPHVEGPRR